MWFAVAPVMVQVKKIKCASADSVVCKECLLMFDAMNNIIVPLYICNAT